MISSMHMMEMIRLMLKMETMLLLEERVMIP